MTRHSLILRTAATAIMPLMLLFSVFIFLAGHQEPGGGFIAALVAADGFATYAMAFGVPVVASRTGSLVEVGGDVPFYFDPLDSEAMAAAIARALSADRSLEASATPARERAARFSWRQTADGTLEALIAARGRD